MALEDVGGTYGQPPGDTSSNEDSGDDPKGSEGEDALVEQEDGDPNEGDGEDVGDHGSPQHLESISGCNTGYS